MTNARPDTRASARKWQTHVQTEDGAKRRSKGVFGISCHFLVISLDYAKHCFMRLRSSYPRELTFIIPQEITKEGPGLTPLHVIFMGDYIYIYIYISCAFLRPFKEDNATL